MSFFEKVRNEAAILSQEILELEHKQNRLEPCDENLAMHCRLQEKIDALVKRRALVESWNRR